MLGPRFLICHPNVGNLEARRASACGREPPPSGLPSTGHTPSTTTAHARESPEGLGPPASCPPGALARNPLRRSPHRPVQTGLRFSLKAASPSRASSVIASSAIWLSV